VAGQGLVGGRAAEVRAQFTNATPTRIALRASADLAAAAHRGEQPWNGISPLWGR
jgi:hypothetical protein